MALSLKILVLLWGINFVPPILTYFFVERWNTPLDRNMLYKDGKPLLGPHKTIRGFLGGILAGWFCGIALGIPWWVGLLAGALSMGGDLLSSFLKRRWEKPSGGIVPGLDQGFEGLLPFLVLGPYYSLPMWMVFLLVFIFCMVAFWGSLFLKEILMGKPFTRYPRNIDPRVRLREFRACQITSNPLHHILNFEDSFYYHFIMKTVFRVLGIYEKGKQNALDIHCSHVTVSSPDLPPAFDGYTILFLSDLHLDGLEGLPERLREILKTIDADVCILGGDLRMETHGPFEEALRHLEGLIPEIRAKDGIYGVLGNHDCTEIIEPLEKSGIKFLVNDSGAIQRNGSEIWLVGVDDPHYYKCHDLELAFKNVPRDAFTILVAHSNEIYREAAEFMPRLYLCGHTHAGQIRIPLLGPVFTHSRAPRRLCWGAWQYRKMLGYTSCGVGVSGVSVRFASRGEVVLMTLRRTDMPVPEISCDPPMFPVDEKRRKL